MSLSPPGVRLFYDPRGHHAGAINELCWGLEEQGVPCQTITYDGGGDAAALEKFADIAELMGENITGLSTLDAAEKAIAAITRLSMDIGIPQHLRDLGVKEADFPYMAEMALKDGNAFSNPRKGNEQEIAAIFRQAF